MSINQKSVARYRMTSIKRWSEPSFKALTGTPSAKLLVLFLEQGQHTTQIPGIFSAGRGALTESIGSWTVEQFMDHFEELQANGTAVADWDAPLVWLPDSLRDFTAPKSETTMKGWANTFSEFPECKLKERSEAYITEFLREFSPPSLVKLWIGRIGKQLRGPILGPIPSPIHAQAELCYQTSL